MESRASIKCVRKEANLGKKKLICKTVCCKKIEETNTYLKHYIFYLFLCFILYFLFKHFIKKCATK